MNYRSFLFASCIGLAFVLGVELYASSWSAGRPVRQWQRAHDSFRVRVTEHVVPRFPLDRYYQVVESAPTGSDHWTHVVTVGRGRGQDVAPDQIKFCNARVGSVHLDNKLYVTNDSGASWHKHEFAPGKITKVIIADDGQGMLWLNATAPVRGRRVLRYHTADHGRSWSRDE